MAECLMVASERGHFETEDDLRRQICKTGRKIHAHGLVVACEGNVSVRLDEDRILVTPSGVRKGSLAPKDLLVADLSGTLLSGASQPSTEM